KFVIDTHLSCVGLSLIPARSCRWKNKFCGSMRRVSRLIGYIGRRLFVSTRAIWCVGAFAVLFGVSRADIRASPGRRLIWIYPQSSPVAAIVSGGYVWSHP